MYFLGSFLLSFLNGRTSLSYSVLVDHAGLPDPHVFLDMPLKRCMVRVAPPDEDDDDSDKEDGDSDDEDGGGKKKRKRKKKRASSDSRRKSLKGTFYGIGPRSFMELGDFLQKVGLPSDRMPQSILHRV